MTSSQLKITVADGEFSALVTRPACGSGPGIILIQEIFGLNDFMRSRAEYFAEEGYVCVVPDLFWRIAPGTGLPYEQADKAFALRQKFDIEQGVEDLGATIEALKALPEQQGKVGAIGYCLGGLMAYLTAARKPLDCAVSYYGVGIENYLDEFNNLSVPMIFHMGETDPVVPPAAQTALSEAVATREDCKAHLYPGAGHAFASPTRKEFNKPAAMMAHSRTIALLRSAMGPIYDLSELWDKHTEYEFGARDVDATMDTMVAEPYVNHIPTMTGGVGYQHLKRFYTNHFVFSNPDDTSLIPVSRTIGSDRVVDEMIFCFTHDREIPWMLPGVAPTGKRVEIPLIAIINFRGDKLYHEHIYWDQASVLVQVGLLDPNTLPVAGVETARKLIDETLPSNELMGDTWAKSA
ncbi:MAG: dienelactone hydrolase family protein [Pseudomonadota bacterium]